MNKSFLCKWGDWDKSAVNSYDTATREVSEDFFSNNNGYSTEEVKAIGELGLDEQYEPEYGNHTVKRIK